MNFIIHYPSFCLAVVCFVVGFCFFTYREFRDCTAREVLAGIGYSAIIVPGFLFLCFLPDIQTLYWTTV